MEIAVNGNYAIMVSDDTLMQNSSKPYIVKFTFDETWEGFSRTAIFEAGPAHVIVALTNDQCIIPAECLKRGSIKLEIGVYGVKGDERKGTVWCAPSLIISAATIDLGSGGSTRPPASDDLYDEIMAAIGDFSAAGFEGMTLAEVFQEIKNSVCGTATDEEVDDMLDDAFGGSSIYPGNPGEESSSNTATDEEVDDVLDAVFGKQP